MRFIPLTNDDPDDARTRRQIREAGETLQSLNRIFWQLDIDEFDAEFAAMAERLKLVWSER